ncbi:preprotein translocase subunit YajC [Streptacidiphilus jiangxiensis]|uniref:Preprotein translocase subunit YajC n=1 Tax=Streptacidiphilus jiangxiensis TaxID=235985 RepID=A0A1H7ZJ60_STRJI|nr:preprotein translocase subunit YajC [Streptacidiphilus jiangxiensis]SEM57984.1 preprotein translocase subunit YajC [Streptacidiphilus jiangxiensis]
MGNPLFFMVIVMAGLMFVTMRSNKKRQSQAQEMRNRLEPGAGVRTIGGMYALVKDVTNEAVELEVAPGVFALYSKQAIAQVMDPVEYNRIVHGEEPETDEATDEDGAADEAAETAVEDAAPAEAKAEDEAAVESAIDPEALAEKVDAKVGSDKDASAK